jgi:type II secretory pathway component PulL
MFALKIMQEGDGRKRTWLKNFARLLTTAGLSVQLVLMMVQLTPDAAVDKHELTLLDIGVAWFLVCSNHNKQMCRKARYCAINTP